VAFQGFCTALEDSRGSEVGRGGASTALRELRTFSGREICKQEPIPWHEGHFLYSARTQPKKYFLLSCLLK
jgi:hypothetical protein